MKTCNNNMPLTAVPATAAPCPQSTKPHVGKAPKSSFKAAATAALAAVSVTQSVKKMLPPSQDAQSTSPQQQAVTLLLMNDHQRLCC
jgi:hypothetical protein